MFSIKKARQLALPILSLCASVAFTSCDSESDNPTPVEANPFVVSLAVAGSDGVFTYYTVPFEDVMSGTLSAVGQGVEQPGYYEFTQFDNTIYSIGGLDNKDVVGISQGEDGQLQRIGNVSFESGLADLIEVDANTLLGLELSSGSDMVKFHTIDANAVTVTNTRQRPVSDITNLRVPAYAGMRISGNHLFLSYYISDPATFNTAYTDKAQVAVYTYPGLEFVKVIEDERTGPIGGFNTKSGLIKDEKGDIYALSHSNPANGYSQTTRDGGILRIRSGEAAFDQNYFFDVEEVTGGKNIAHLKYLGNGKALAEINTAANTDQVRWSDGPLRTAIVDLYNKTVTYIDGIPEHPGHGRRLSALHNESFVYMAIQHNDKRNFVYKIDLQNNTATKGAEVNANFVAGFFRL
ncbi:DUF4374 domain-containing protein [Pontibacter akesuensis]|uniref:DUF4374 domain-containing protein n=1 Tax=Pontibacter akesuensis TaxID=388950 RepID=A0A1I7KDY2_9BACT|nr:DUF4374 domain-containing protein [Pontibacter akesuensis]GHA79959.1 hypothetical protein GCM10007389_37800 [Pontibacter akesuensis]SFU95570.1 protein of unknown function [Pontibacter akesuensis]